MEENAKPATQVISQTDLAELETLRGDVRLARRAYDKARNEILKALERGADIEPGPYRAEFAIRAKLHID